jgi:1,4-alpha-glucan branching enzyme
MPQTILTPQELESLTRLQTNAPHSLLGMHPLGSTGRGIVVRAYFPDADRVRVEPVLEKGMPSFDLESVDGSGLFEGQSKDSSQVYAYDLVVKFRNGDEFRTRDPFSFLPTLSEQDLFLFNEGKELQLFEKLGAHTRTIDGVEGVSFAVWAPNAKRVSVCGDFNDWDGRRHMMRMLAGSGIWEIFIPGVARGAHYKYELLDDCPHECGHCLAGRCV